MDIEGLPQKSARPSFLSALPIFLKKIYSYRAMYFYIHTCFSHFTYTYIHVSLSFSLFGMPWDKRDIHLEVDFLNCQLLFFLSRYLMD